MKTYRLTAIQETMQGCVENEYKSIVRASYFLIGFLRGNDIDCDEKMKPFIKESLYRKYMRAYSRYIKNNPNIIKEISEDCCFSSMMNGEYTGIDESYN